MKPLDHHNFILATDRKSLHAQLKKFIGQAHDVASKELQKRRQHLQDLLNFEENIYEEEFKRKVKSRIDEDIAFRRQALLKIAEENAKIEKDFLESKHVQQHMNSCYEIREALRHKERQQTKECQLEQMVEKERALTRERELGKYWQNVAKINGQREDERQASENCLKQMLIKQTKLTLDVQMEEKAEKRAEELKVKHEEEKALNALLEEMRLEAFDRQRLGMPAKVLKYRNELLETIEKNRKAKCEEALELAEEHRKMIRELQQIEAEELAAIKARKQVFNKASLEFIDYMQRMHRLEEDQQKKRDNRLDELARVDICTKRNLENERKQKAAYAAQCHAELKKQVCLEYERRLHEAAEHRECKILENRFVHTEITRAEILAQRQKNRIELDKQIAELKRLRAAEEEVYKSTIRRATNDPEFCTALAAQYMREGVDYLEPHANWRILACPTKKYVPKLPQAYPECKDLHGELSKRRLNIASCGCGIGF